MPHFGPLPRRGPIDSDGLRRWFSGETITAQRLITGSLQASQIISSANFNSGSAGWQIDGDGNAEFNDVTVRGTIIADDGELGDLDVSGTLLIASTGIIRLLSGAKIQFTRNSTAIISTNHNPQNGDLWIEYRGNSAGAIIGMRRVAGNDLVVAQQNVGISGFEISTGTFAFQDGTAGAPGITFGLDTDTGIYRVGTNLLGITTNGALAFSVGGGNNLIGASDSTVRVGAGSTGAPGFAFENDTNTGIYRVGSGRIGFSADGTLAFEIRTNSGNPDIYIYEDFDNVGNVETLRAVRTGGGTGMTKVGYNSSFLFDQEGKKLKLNVAPVASKLWQREWFLDIEPISYRHKVSKGIREIKERIPGYQPDEFGFSIENLSEHTNMLTTSGNQQGSSVDEKAILAVTVDYVQHLERRVRALELLSHY